MEKKLTKSTTEKKICGVCGGLAKYLDADVNTVRLIAVVAALFSCSLVAIAYVAAAVILPDDTTVDNMQNTNNTASNPAPVVTVQPEECTPVNDDDNNSAK